MRRVLRKPALLPALALLAAAAAYLWTAREAAAVDSDADGRDQTPTWGNYTGDPVYHTTSYVVIRATTTNAADKAIDLDLQWNGQSIAGSYGVDGNGTELDDPANNVFAVTLHTNATDPYPSGTQFTVVATYYAADGGAQTDQETTVTTKP